MISVDEAKKIFNAAQSRVVDSEEIQLKDASTRILAVDVKAEANIPDFDNSAMDGFASTVKYLHEHCKTGTPIAIVEEVAAGDAPSVLNTSAPVAVRIFTGAPIPEGADCVVPVENCIVENNNLSIREEFKDLKKYCKKNQHIRPRGLNFTIGELVLKKGTKLGSMNIAVLASLGFQKVTVYKRLKVAIGVTGDELISGHNSNKISKESLDIPLGKIHDSNTSLLRHLCSELGFDIVLCTHINDTLKATQDFLLTASKAADVILSSGGISMGEKDFIKLALRDEKMFETMFQTLALKPGKPFTFARCRNDTNTQNEKQTPILAMPGNPLSVFITFMYFAVPYMYSLAGKGDTEIQLETVASPSAFGEYSRTRFLFARKENNRVVLLHEQGSAAIKNLRNSEGALIVPAHKSIEENAELEYFPFHQFGHL